MYSTVFGDVVVYERTTDDGRFALHERLDFSGDNELFHYPLAIDRDVLVVGFGNEYWIFPREDGVWGDGAFRVENGRASAGVPSVAVSGRDVLGGSRFPHEVYHYDVRDCMHAMPTVAPTRSSAPTPTTPAPTSRPSLRPSVSGIPTRSPTTEAPTTAPTHSHAPTSSNAPSVPPTHSNDPTWRPSLRPSISSVPSINPTPKETPASPTTLAAPPGASSITPISSPTAAPTLSNAPTYSNAPTASPTHSNVPTWHRSSSPSISFVPTPGPTAKKTTASPTTIISISSAPTTPHSTSNAPSTPSSASPLAASPPDDGHTTDQDGTTGGTTACLTREECEKKSRETDAASFSLGNFPTKGCFSKGDGAFFSDGTAEEMSTPELSGTLVRIWCDESVP